MEREYTVKYKPAAQQPPAVPKTEKRSVDMFDKNTDSNIFALGDAASQLDNVDDLFAGFGFNLSDILWGDQPEGTVTKTYRVTPPKDSAEITNEVTEAKTEVEETSSESVSVDNKVTSEIDKKGTIQVSTISKTLSDGKTVHTRLIQGPIRCKKRIMKISRETPNGPELIATMEAPPDSDKAAIVNSLPHTLSGTQRPAVGFYDNVHFQDPNADVEIGVEPAGSIPMQVKSPPKVAEVVTCRETAEPYGVPELSPLNKPAPFPVTMDDLKNSGITTPTLERNHSLVSPPSPTPIFTYSEVPIITPTQNIAPVVREETVNLLQKPNATSTESPIKSLVKTDSVRSKKSEKATSRRMSVFPDEDAIQAYHPPDYEPLDDSDGNGYESEGRCSRCCKCAIFSRSRKTRFRKSMVDNSKGKSGMTASEINTDDKALPGLQALIANYARMFYDDRAQFVDTLFRAVKLNKLDVTRILCKIIQKSGSKLSSHDLREPESSATIFHVALLYNHTAIVDFLLRLKDTELIMSKYETVEYRNQTGLHVAVANGDPNLIEKLLEALEVKDRQELINTVADGKYFRAKHPHGQLCLTAAAWASNEEVIKILVKHGGNLAIKNHAGNTLIHSIILQSEQHPDRTNYENLFQSVWEATGIWASHMTFETLNPHQKELEQKQMQINLFKDLLLIRNNDGYTPLALATMLNSVLFKYMINFEKIYKIPQNKLGSIAWVTYDVTDITSFANDSYNKFCVLHLLAHNSQRLSRRANIEYSEGAEDSLEMEPVNTLLHCKWGAYRWVYIIWLFIHVMFMMIFTAFTAETHTSHFFNTTMGRIDFRVKPAPVQWNAILFLILPVIYIFLELLDLYGNRPYRISYMTGQNYLRRCLKCIQSEWTITGNGPYRLVSIGFACFTIQWFMLYATKDANQDIALAMALLLGWIFVLFFTRGCRVTCRFSIMIQKMFFRDLIYFLTVYGIVLIAFSFAINAMFSYRNDSNNSINNVFYDMMNVVTDLDQKQTIDTARHPMFARMLLIFYALVAVILLMNMLIAMMNTSYETVRITRSNLWRQQQLSILLMLERRFFWFKWLCRKSERDVWKKESDQDVRCYLDVTMLHTPSYKCYT